MHLATRSSLSQSRRSPCAYSPPTPLPSGLACGGSQPLRCQHHGLGPSMSQRELQTALTALRCSYGGVRGMQGAGPSPGGTERPLPLSPGSQKAGFSAGTWT